MRKKQPAAPSRRSVRPPHAGGSRCRDRTARGGARGRRGQRRGLRRVDRLMGCAGICGPARSGAGGDSPSTPCRRTAFVRRPRIDRGRLLEEAARRGVEGRPGARPGDPARPGMRGSVSRCGRACDTGRMRLAAAGSRGGTTGWMGGRRAGRGGGGVGRTCLPRASSRSRYLGSRRPRVPR